MGTNRTRGLLPPWEPGQSGNSAGRPSGIQREGENRHLVITDCQEIADMLQGMEVTEETLRKKTRLWVMLYRLSIKDPKTFLGYYAGMPRQAVDLDATSAGPIPILVTYVNRPNGIDDPTPGADAKTT